MCKLCRQFFEMEIVRRLIKSHKSIAQCTRRFLRTRQIPSIFCHFGFNVIFLFAVLRGVLFYYSWSVNCLLNNCFTVVKTILCCVLCVFFHGTWVVVVLCTPKEKQYFTGKKNVYKFPSTNPNSI